MQLLWDKWTVSQRYCVLLRTPLPIHLVDYFKVLPWRKLTYQMRGTIGRVVQRDGPVPGQFH